MTKPPVQFSSLKILGHMDRIEQYRRGVNVAPITVEFHLTNHCQHDCWFCSDAIRRSAGMDQLPSDVVERTIRDFAEMGVKSVVFEGGGEPTLSRHFDMAWRLASDLGMAVGLTTNGGLLHKPADRLALVAERASWVRLSLDAATPETHQIMHRGQHDFMRILESASALRAANPELTLGWSFIISDENKHEVLVATERAHDLGFSYIDLKPLLVGRKECVLADGVADAVREALTRSRNRFRVYAARIDGSSARVHPFSVCHSHRFIGNVSATGDVYVCCAHAMQDGTPDRAQPRDNVVLGNVKETSFRDIWNSAARERIAALYADPAVVKTCPQCRFAHHNEVLEAVMGDVTFSPFV